MEMTLKYGFKIRCRNIPLTKNEYIISNKGFSILPSSGYKEMDIRYTCTSTGLQMTTNE